MAGDRPTELAERQPTCSQMLVAQHDIAAAHQPTGEGQDAHEAAGQHLEQVLVERAADCDGKPRLLAHLALEGGAMILSRIGPAARQVPFVALVQQQEHTVLIDQDAFDGDGVRAHCVGKYHALGMTISLASGSSSQKKRPGIAPRPFRNI